MWRYRLPFFATEINNSATNGVTTNGSSVEVMERELQCECVTPRCLWTFAPAAHTSVVLCNDSCVYLRVTTALHR